MCAWKEPDILSVLFYICQVPFLWSFYAMFFMYGVYADAMCVSAGLCVAGCLNFFHFFSLAPAAGWCLMPYVASMFGHLAWTLRVALSHGDADEDAVLGCGGVAHCVCYCGDREQVHECALSGL
jgi:hypothetical protein